MKKIILLTSLLATFSVLATDISGMFDNKEKSMMCGGRNPSSYSPIFGNVSSAGSNVQMASLSAKVHKIQTINGSDKNAISNIYIKAKADREYTAKSKNQFDQLGAHYNRRGSAGKQVYNSTSSGLNNSYQIISTHANENVYEILNGSHNIKIFNKQRRVGYTNLDVLTMCQQFWY